MVFVRPAPRLSGGLAGVWANEGWKRDRFSGEGTVPFWGIEVLECADDRRRRGDYGHQFGVLSGILPCGQIRQYYLGGQAAVHLPACCEPGRETAGGGVKVPAVYAHVKGRVSDQGGGGIVRLCGAGGGFDPGG